MTCRTCKHMHVHPDSDGVHRVRKSKMYPCRVPTPVVHWPDCITKAHGFIAKPHRSMVSPEWGVECPLWESKSTCNGESK